MAVEVEDFSSSGRLFHSGTIQLKKELLKVVVLQRFGLNELVELKRV